MLYCGPQQNVWERLVKRFLVWCSSRSQHTNPLFLRSNLELSKLCTMICRSRYPLKYSPRSCPSSIKEMQNLYFRQGGRAGQLLGSLTLLILCQCFSEETNLSEKAPVYTRIVLLTFVPIQMQVSSIN